MIGSLKHYYLLSHHEVHKRSTEPSHKHHLKLNDEPEVRWFEQQREKRRVKRDYSPYERASFSQLTRRLQSHRPHYRALSSGLFFPDPLFKEQWYLNGGAKDGLDMNVSPAWQKGYTGKGIVVSILDDGIQTNHPDLVQNYDPNASTDINGNDDDPMPQDNGDNKHGTRCAGEVAAVAYNQYCGVGIAYNASIGGVRMLDGVVNDAVEARALGLNPDHIDIYSASWGPEDDGKTVDGPGPLARRAFIYGVTSGRRGKGSIFVWASGNGGRHTDSCNCDGYTNSIFTLSISSATQGGYKPWYLEECSSTLATTYSSGTPGHDKSVATVDMDGRLRSDHICTVEHTGTSASAPLAAGICALALEANPKLTWRDMQYLVVMTSRPQPLEKEGGWIVNGVKRKVSHKFGYGLMDASEMVTLAEQWVSVPPQHICKSQEINEDKQIDSTYGYTLSAHMDVNGCSSTVNEVRYLEHVQCKISLRFFPRGNLRILLTSPMGTVSTLLFERPRDVVSSNFDDWPFLSVHFWGEHAEGRWTLQIVNGGNRHVNQPGILKKWQLIFYGTAIDPVRLKSKRPSQGALAFALPTAADGFETIGDSFYNTDAFANYQNFPNLFAAGSDPEKAVARLDGHNVPSPHGENVLADSNDKRVVHDCDPECDSQGCYGKGPTQCIACKNCRLDDACVSRCPPRSYANKGGVCWPCHESCETCVGPGQDSCLTCAPAHLLVADLAVCLQQCPDGYWEDSESSVCRPCAAHCATCSERADGCTSCEHHLVLHDGTCLASCPASHYETEDYMCAKCHESCDTCEGSGETQCVTCHPSTYSLDGRCVSSCPSGYYADKKRKECMRCPVGCLTCTSAFCLTCESNWELNKKGKCVRAGTDKCSSTEYSEGLKCKRCSDACDSCYGENEDDCLTCQSPNFLQNYKCVSECSRGFYPEAGRCARCMHGCSECVSRLNCTLCGGSLRLQSGACRTSCADGYYADRGTCSKCYLSCRTCIGPRRDQCASCPEGWRLAAGECHPECPQGFYQSLDGCRHCHHYCRECDGSGPLHCKSCPPRFMLDGGVCMECLGSQYYEGSSGKCKSCEGSCRTCSGPGQFSCTTCSRPLRLDRLNNQCVPCCPDRGATNSTPENDCCRCHPDSGECINSSVAGKRRIAEWSALHAVGPNKPQGSPGAALLVTGVCAAAVALFVAVLAVLQARSPREQPKKTRARGVAYTPLSCTDDDITVLPSRAAFSIGSLKHYYLLSHHEVHKRSTEPSHKHHLKLNDEPEVRWFEQQREKRRVKRDYSPYERASFSQLTRRLQSHRPHYRALSSGLFFPDPLFKEQWYLNGGAKDGLDMNVSPAWQKGYTGKGIVVSILDDGIQTNHPDLVQNYDPNASTDINGNDDDPMPQDNGDNKHGTRCAGEVAAVAYNQYCGVGIAYNASIGGVRMLDGVVNDAVEARALGLNPDHIDIYSASWGPEDDGKTVDGPGPLARRAFIYGVTSGRRGKGSIFVWASGNGGRHTDSCNCDGYTNSIFTLSISSATQGGYKPWYLEECSSTLATTYSSGTPGHDKSVATVDMDGRLRSDHICTVEHTGTSASAPLAAGICALALEANPKLTWRDMQYLVVMTSRPQPLEKEGGWIVNGVKRKVSHKFGYGLMDASEMVTLAEQWVSVPPQHICKSQEINEDKQIDSTYGYTLSAHMDVNGCSSTVNEVRYLEHVQCKISLRFFPRGNLRILLTSPMGTVSTLLFERPRDVVSSNFDDWPFLSVHFWGEHAEGRWTLQIVNGGNRHVNQPGILKKWQLIFYGTAIDPVRLKSKRPSQGALAFALPTAADGFETIGDSFYNTDAFANYQNFPNLFAAGSDPEKAVARLDGHNVPSPHGENVLADSNDKRVVHDCDPECDSQGCYGKGPTQCIACKNCRLDDACVSRCPPRSYANKGGVCWPCHESCETCVGPGQDSCLTCAPAHLLVADLAVCLQQCPDGYWEDSESSVCRPCAAHCATCSERADGCTSCEHHLVLHDGTCLASCPASHYETEDYMCAKCHESCDTCEGSGEAQCVTCHPSTYSLDGRCVSSCPSGYYADKKRKECMRCPVGCLTCTSAFCLTCESNWELNKKGKCVRAGTDKCSSTEYSEGLKCKRCSDACDSCYGENEDDCLTCQSPNFLQNYKCVSECSRGFYPEAGRCARCMHGCSECVSRLNCTLCGGSLRLQSGACRTSCADGYYADRGTCSKCYLSCRTCIGPRRDQCASCPEGWRLAAGECHPECPQGFYQSLDGCRHCHHYCRECDGSGPLHCKSCPPRFMLDGGVCMECLGSQYYEGSSGKCKSCEGSCRTCSGPGQFSCTTCSRPLRLDRLNNQCVPCCHDRGATNSTPENDCCRCHPDSGECINSSVAGKRRIAEWSALHAVGPNKPKGSPGAALLVTGVCAAAVALFVAVLAVLQARSPREQPKKTRARGVAYTPLSCTDDDITVLPSRAAFSVSERETERDQLLEYST